MHGRVDHQRRSASRPDVGSGAAGAFGGGDCTRGEGPFVTLGAGETFAAVRVADRVRFFSVSESHVTAVVAYISGQQEHHHGKHSFKKEEFVALSTMSATFGTDWPRCVRLIFCPAKHRPIRRRSGLAFIS
jgi:hypothetical protein